MLILGRESFRPHRPWLVVCLALTVAAAGWYFVYARRTPAWPGGSSPPGFAFGVIGGLICIFESLLWVRKRWRGVRVGRVRLGATRTWMRAHIWLGLLSLPLLLLHAGPRWGGTLSTAVMVVFLLTVASGVWGLWLQNRLPTRIYSEVPGETIASQIPFVMAQHLREVSELVDSRCESAAPTPADVGLDSIAPSSAFMTLAELGSSPGSGRTTVDRPPVEDTIPGTRPVRLFFDNHVAAYLRDGAEGGSVLANPAQAERMFRDVEAVAPVDALFVMRSLETMCNLRRQYDRQERLHLWLHNWICVHLPLTAALLILMGVHIWAALRYW